MHPRQLAIALRERGLTPIHIVRLAAAGPNKTKVAETVAALTSCQPFEARRMTDRLGTVLEVEDRHAAEDAAARLREVGAFVEITVAELCLYAYDPNDPRGGDQPIERLRIVAFKHAHEHGKLGAWADVPLASHGEADGVSLLAAIDELRANWSARGKLEAASELEILERVRARDLEAEHRLRASAGEQRSHETTVYTDWLLCVGDPRGSFAAALAGPIAEADARRLFDDHRLHLFGLTKQLLDVASWTWTGPVLDKLTLRLPACGARRADFEELLAQPVCACLSALTFEVSPSKLDLGEVVTVAACASGLRALRIMGGHGLRLTGDRFARLETLVVVHEKFFRLGPLRLPALRSLDVTLVSDAVALHEYFEQLYAPKLEHFSLRLVIHEFGAGEAGQQLIDVLRLPAFASLRTLTLATMTPVPFSPNFAEQLVRVPAMATLERIDLRELLMNDDCYVELAARRDEFPGLVLRR